RRDTTPVRPAADFYPLRLVRPLLGALPFLFGKSATRPQPRPVSEPAASGRRLFQRPAPCAAGSARAAAQLFAVRPRGQRRPGLAAATAKAAGRVRVSCRRT